MSFRDLFSWLAALILVFLSLNTARSQEDPFLSALPGNAPEEWELDKFSAGSARTVARPWSSLRHSIPYSRIPDVSSVTGTYQALRNERFLKDTTHGGRLRRLPWLYPDDGCYYRADAGVRRLRTRGYPAPAKVFAFGHLRTRTPHHPNGRVAWWYHVAPLVRSGGALYVLDPAIDHLRPLPIESWLGRMSGTPGSVNVSICSPGAYGPSSICVQNGPSPRDFASVQSTYLNLEWNRVRQLGWNPDRVLGDEPPWSFAWHFKSGATSRSSAVRKPGAAIEPARVLEYLATRLAKYKLPKRVLFVDELPRNTMGKVQNNALRERHRKLYTDGQAL